jgi:hypothetical protein
MDQDKAKTPTEPTKEPAPDGRDFGELLIAGMQELLGASDEDLRRWREQLMEHSRPVLPGRAHQQGHLRSCLRELGTGRGRRRERVKGPA